MGGRETRVDIDRKTIDLDALGEQELRALVPQLLVQIETLKTQLAQFRRMIFGRRSEKSRTLDTTGWLPFVKVDELRAAAEK